MPESGLTQQLLVRGRDARLAERVASNGAAGTSTLGLTSPKQCAWSPSLVPASAFCSEVHAFNWLSRAGAPLRPCSLLCTACTACPPACATQCSALLFAGKCALMTQASAGLRGGACTSTKLRCSCSATSAAAPCCRAATPTSCPPRGRCGAAWGGRRQPSCRSAGPAPHQPTRCRTPLTPHPPPPGSPLLAPALAVFSPSALCVLPPTHSRLSAHLSHRLARPAPSHSSDVRASWGRRPGSLRTRRSSRSLAGCPGAAQEAAATVIQKSFRRHLMEVDLRRRAFSRFGDEALDLIRRRAPAPAAPPTLISLAGAA
jgi:hypothetical protein